MTGDDDKLARKLEEFEAYLSWRRQHFCQVNSSGEIDRTIELIDAGATPAQLRDALAKYSRAYRPNKAPAERQ